MSNDVGIELESDLREPQPRGNAGLLAELFNTQHVRLVGFLAKKLGGDRTQAGDLAQETYTRIAAYKGALTRENSRGFLFQVARNLLIDHYRSRQQIPLGSTDSLAALAAPAADPAQLVLAESELRQLKAIILTLPPRCQQVFILHRFEQLSYAQIAERCGVSVSMVEKQMTKAMRRIGEAMR